MSQRKTKKGSAATAEQKRSAKTRALIVDAAIKEFAAHGFHDTKVSEIVARAGVTQPAFYFYFPSKQAIYDHLLQRAHDELLATVYAARLPPGVDRTQIPERVRAAIEVFLQYFVDNPLLANIGYFQSPISAGIRDEIISTLSRHIAYEQGAGYYRRDFDPVFIAECYGGTLERVIQRHLFTGKSTARDIAIHVADLFLNGIQARETNSVEQSQTTTRKPKS